LNGRHVGVQRHTRSGVHLFHGDFLDLCRSWPAPAVIVSDGPYGLRGFPGDPPTADALPEWYEPFIRAWSARSTPRTTLWFWNSEIGWATVHPRLAALGWRYRGCNVWNKGMQHIAGNANSATLRKFPVVTEVCVQYVRDAEFDGPRGKLSMQDWLRHEWRRAGLPFYLANSVCGVANAATRKYLTPCHLWYYPPPEAFAKLAAYANERGNPSGRPYFSLDGRVPISAARWARLRAEFNCEVGVTNVWSVPAVRGDERIKVGSRSVHLNQKPLQLLELILRASSSEGDVVWEPFGGLCSTAIAAFRLRRRSFSSETLEHYYRTAVDRLGRAVREERPPGRVRARRAGGDRRR
jgi:site-specific DNA-methyltransferase (adenine-specific)